MDAGVRIFSALLANRRWEAAEDPRLPAEPRLCVGRCVEPNYCLNKNHLVKLGENQSFSGRQLRVRWDLWRWRPPRCYSHRAAGQQNSAPLQTHFCLNRNVRKFCKSFKKPIEIKAVKEKCFWVVNKLEARFTLLAYLRSKKLYLYWIIIHVLFVKNFGLYGAFFYFCECLEWTDFEKQISKI